MAKLFRSNFQILRLSADGNYEVRYKSNVLIYPNGEVLWVPPAIYQVIYNFLFRGIYFLKICNFAEFLHNRCNIFSV